MASHNTYLEYKRDTQYIVYWMIQASNTIIKNSSASLGDDAPKIPNANGEITVRGLVALAKVISKNISPIPTAIYRLFQSVIKARTGFHTIFQQAAKQNPDPELKRQNSSHKHFIDALTEAFTALGGDEWESGQEAKEGGLDEDEDIEQVIFANKFNALNLNEVKPSEEDGDVTSDDESDQEKPIAAAQRRRQKIPSGKGKKGRRGKKGKRKQKASAIEKPGLDAVPLESYRIIHDEDGIITDFLMAIYGLIQEWGDLRSHLQKLWAEVAYDGLNGAVAAAISNVAITMVKQTETAIFVDFPGHDSYETALKTITRGDLNKAQGMFSVQLLKFGPDSTTADVVHETAIDIKEQFLIHTYYDLLDFVTDFQKTRSGKPTKRMLADIRNWDPRFDVQRASKEERIRWRRSYTINWLYDLVNVFSSIVVQRNTMRGENHDYAKVDWSIEGPWNEHTRIYGLQEFAGFVTSLAMQPTGTDTRQKILPHHVFQLQCIVDSFTVSRGWSTSALRGHIIIPPAQGFRPRRDVDLFLDRQNERFGKGYLQAVDVLKQLFEKDNELHADPGRHVHHHELLEHIEYDFVNWLGESKYMHGLNTIPPSRFSNTNSNGLWEYSPFLCGVGLMEGLEIAYMSGMKLWDQVPEVVLTVHLHNMLVQKGYITRPVGLYGSLQELFSNSFFLDGKVPTSDFLSALRARVNATGARQVQSARHAFQRAATRSAADIHSLLDVKANRFFANQTMLTSYQQAKWDYVRIPDSELPVTCCLAMIRISQTGLVIDTDTGQTRLKDTELVQRARAQGMDDATLLNMSSKLLPALESKRIEELPEAVLSTFPEEYRTKYQARQNNAALKHSRYRRKAADLSKNDLLELLKWDIMSDVCGVSPLLSLNYVWVTARIMMLFIGVENKLREANHPGYFRVYETHEFRNSKRLGLAVMALRDDDEFLLRTIAEEFEEQRGGFLHHIYWEDLESVGDRLTAQGQRTNPNELELDGCTVM